MMGKIKILIADDHALFREGIRALLSSYNDLEVAGEAADGSEAIEQVKKLRPDIVLLDIAMPGLGGLEATLELKKLFPDVKILILTQFGSRSPFYHVSRNACLEEAIKVFFICILGEDQDLHIGKKLLELQGCLQTP